MGEGQGLNTTVLGLKRHPDLRDLIIQILLLFAKHNFYELFAVHLKRVAADTKDLLSLISQLYKPLSESALSKDEVSTLPGPAFLGGPAFLAPAAANRRLPFPRPQLATSGVFDEWYELALENASAEFTNTQDVRILSLCVLVQQWLSHQQRIEEQGFKANSIIQMLSKASRDKSLSLSLHALSHQFSLLQTFALSKNAYAPIVYKSISLSLIENFNNLQLREFMLLNFMQVFSKIDSIPLNILLDPLIRQIQVAESASSLNVFDFQFFAYVANSAKLNIKNGILLFDILAKIYLNNTVQASMVFQPIVVIVQRFSEDATLQELVNKFIKVSLAILYSLEKKKLPKPKAHPSPSKKDSSAEQQAANAQEQEVLNAQKRNQIVVVINSLIRLNISTVNEKAKPLIAHTNIQIKLF